MLGIRVLKYKIAVAVALLALLWWLVIRCFPKSSSPRSPYTTCDQLFANVHKYLVHEAFDEREESFVARWASTNVPDAETCSYYNFHRISKKLMMGHKMSDGRFSNQYVTYAKDEDGVIRFYHEHDPTILLGYIYPIYYDSFGPGLGYVECSDLHGDAEWKATISVPLNLLSHFAEDMVTKGIETFKEIGPQLGVDVHLGNFYRKTCWDAPIWSRLPNRH